MTNYKPAHISITPMGFDIPVPPGVKIVQLFYPHGGATSAQSLFDQQTIAQDYVVPIGKKLIIKSGFITTDTTAGAYVAIFEGDTADAVTTVKARVHGSKGWIHYFYLDIEFAAEKYVTSNPTTTGVGSILLNGYEVNE